MALADLVLEYFAWLFFFSTQSAKRLEGIFRGEVRVEFYFLAMSFLLGYTGPELTDSRIDLNLAISHGMWALDLIRIRYWKANVSGPSQILKMSKAESFRLPESRFMDFNYRVFDNLIQLFLTEMLLHNF